MIILNSQGSCEKQSGSIHKVLSVPEPVSMDSWKSIAHISPKLLSNSSLKSVMVGVFTLQKSANTTNTTTVPGLAVNHLPAHYWLKLVIMNTRILINLEFEIFFETRASTLQKHLILQKKKGGGLF